MPRTRGDNRKINQGGKMNRRTEQTWAAYSKLKDILALNLQQSFKKVVLQPVYLTCHPI